MYGDAPALVEGERSLSFREFDAATDRLGNALLAKGLVAGDRVAILLPNGIECLIVYYALAKSGLVRVPLHVREALTNHRYKLADSGARALIYADETALDAELLIDADELNSLIKDGDGSPCRVDRDLDAPLRLGYTGGTTGEPKAVTLTTRGELAELSAFLVDLVPDIQKDNSFLHAAPIGHASGAFFLPTLVRGARNLVLPAFDAAAFVALAEREKPSHTFLVPTMLSIILESTAVAADAHRFRRICYGASSIAPALLARAIERFGNVFAQTYGQAESPMVITCLQPEDHGRIGSCGRPFTTVDVAEKGEIVCRGPQTMARYWNRPEATAEVFHGGWLHTGDIGRMDEDGFFYILDRKNDMLISGGYNVYPREVEDVLISCDGVVAAAVVGLPDEKWGDRVHAVVSGRSGLDVAKLAAVCKEQLADYKRPKGIDIWPELPKTAAGKILRREVKQRLLTREAMNAAD
jgi:acyl-CoA synthetase (AMP-forming)/AMP-acid ligase II